VPNSVRLGELVRKVRELRTFFAFSFDSIALYAPDGTIVGGNQAARTLVGGRLRGAHFSEHVAPSQMEIVQPHFLAALAGEQRDFSTTFVSGTGKELNVEVRLVPAVVDGETVGVIGFARDVTARDRAVAGEKTAREELALRRS
jgi:PAS domain S-box-containing protein